MSFKLTQFNLFESLPEQRALIIDLPVYDKLLQIKGTNQPGLISEDALVTQPFYDQSIAVQLVYELDSVIKEEAVNLTLKGQFGKMPPADWPRTIPAVQQWSPLNRAERLSLNHKDKILVLDPSLIEVATLFQAELKGKGLELELLITEAERSEAVRIIFSSTESINLIDEAYYMEMQQQQIKIFANHPTGAFYATRTLLQLDVTNLDSGIIYDYPRYQHRGFMLDVGRKFVPYPYLLNIVDQMAYYKLNDLQLHLNDNYIFLQEHVKGKGLSEREELEYVLKHALEGFRIESSIKNSDGEKLTSKEYYSKEELTELANYAAKRGVKIVPEIDTPGHALSLTRIRPDLIYRGKLSEGKHYVERAAMLDLEEQYEATLAFVLELFDDLLDPEDGALKAFDTIHIGTDEYYGNPEKYRKYVNELIQYIQNKGLTPRLWGSLTNKKGSTEVNLTGTEVHIWSLDWQNPSDLFGTGCKLINIIDNPTYSVPSGKGDIRAYGDYSDYIAQYNQWSPHDFTLAGGESYDESIVDIIGGAFAIWNDNTDLHETGITPADIYDRFLKTLPVVSEKTWGSFQAPATYNMFQETVLKNLTHITPPILASSPEEYKKG